VVAKCFNSQANVDQEVKVIFGKLDKNQDGLIDLREWVSVLFDLFRFMSANAFEKHCEELLALLTKAHGTAASGAHPAASVAAH
jgi:Ca2+-binding EF-hand superfamily protein